jgi:hypothetical protein
VTVWLLSVENVIVLWVGRLGSGCSLGWSLVLSWSLVLAVGLFYFGVVQFGG